MNVREFADSLNNLDPDNIGSWPMSVKVFLWLLAAGLCGFLVYMLVLSKSMDNLTSEQEKEKGLISTYESKSFKAANLDAYKEQMEGMKTTFGALLRQLPSDTEVPGLLEDITQTGVDSGLEFESINLGTENIKEFYVELPISIVVKGGYHALGEFVSGVSALPRIVTLHDFDISSSDVPDQLKMSITAKTYRYKEGE